jgi:hypothetical protein
MRVLCGKVEPGAAAFEADPFGVEFHSTGPAGQSPSGVSCALQRCPVSAVAERFDAKGPRLHVPRAIVAGPGRSARWLRDEDAVTGQVEDLHRRRWEPRVARQSLCFGAQRR